MIYEPINIKIYIISVLSTLPLLFIFNYYIRYFINKDSINKKYLFIETLIFITILLTLSLILLINNFSIELITTISFFIIPYLFIFIKKRFYIKKWNKIWIYYNLIEFIYLLISLIMFFSLSVYIENLLLK